LSSISVRLMVTDQPQKLIILNTKLNQMAPPLSSLRGIAQLWPGAMDCLDIRVSTFAVISVSLTGALQGIFSQIINGEDPIREKAIKFLQLKLKLMGEEILTSKIEEYIVEESKKVTRIIWLYEFLCGWPYQFLCGLEPLVTL